MDVANLNNGLQIRQLAFKDLLTVYQWVQDENWTPFTLEELHLWYNIYPDCFLGVYNETNQLLSHLFRRNVDGNTAYVELFITGSEYRGKGIGSMLFDHALNRKSGCATVIVCVPGKESFYVDRGLQETGFSVVQFFQLWFRENPLQSLQHEVRNKEDMIQIHRITNDTDVVRSILEYDFTLHRKDRKELIKTLINNNKYTCLYAYDRKLEAVVGFIVVIKTETENKVEILCGESQRIACKLLLFCIPYCNVSLPFLVAFSNMNMSQATELYEQIFDVKDKEPLIENILSTNGKLDAQILWGKMYSVSCLTYMGFF